MKIENVRVAQATNYEKLKLKIETDGTVTPKDAANQAVKILLDHFTLLIKDEADKKVKEEPAKIEQPKEEVKEEKPAEAKEEK